MHFYYYFARSVILVIVGLSLTTEMAYHTCKHHRLVFWSLVALTAVHISEGVCYGLHLLR